ncbi:MAG: serine hydroxymethyltransferase [Patescibacteria group bacterium]
MINSVKDKILNNLIKKEINRQQKTINLIASENFASPEILKIVGSPLMNKYSEGYAAEGRRYYPGNQYYDEIENLAQERALKAFKLKAKSWSVNVQPYSGSPANLEIYFALLNFGDVLMGMELTNGGHLTHGHKVNFSGVVYKTIQYGVDKKTGLIDYKEVERLAKKHKPKIIVSGATAYPRKIDFKKFGEIAKKVGAYHMVDISHISGLVVAGLHQSPFPYSDVVMTTTHKILRGPRAAIIFCKRELADKIDRAVFPGMQGGPHNNTIAAIAEMFFETKKQSFKKYQKQVIKNAQALAKSLKKYGFDLVAGGTDNHLILINLGGNGFEAEKKLETAGILANRNSVPGDASPFRPSGLRLGTPALTTRGMKEKEMRQIADWIFRILIKNGNSALIKKEVEKLCKKFPAPK